MADDRTLPFPERAHQNYKEEIENLKYVAHQSEPETAMEQTVNEEYIAPVALQVYREPLAITERKEVTIELSTGGPADGYKIYFDQAGEAVEGFYYFADWFEYEEFRLTPEEIDRVVDIYF